MKSSFFILALLAVFMPASLLTAQNKVKPVHGTFINFTYMDERNKYMNPSSADMTDPLLWKQKVNELSEVGIKYLVLMYVANDSKSFYPSTFMKPAYNPSKESPVDAIINEADKLGMKVFMSTGWAKNQDDDPGLPEIRAIQVKIMEETAHLYSKRKSFYGWYLPCEDVVGPFLSQKAVDAANSLSAKARELTPGARVMISPYGLKSARFDDGKYLEQISKLKVDIIAYQDEIGCVVEPLPLNHMKENFRHLREVHDKAKIELWANDEFFTWEKGLNTRPSALIPAPFPRFLSQLAGVSDAGVDEVISFAFCGIMDKPSSKYPLGQPYYGNKAYEEYSDWLNGKNRWPLLEATFRGNVKHDAISKSVISAATAIVTGTLEKLTDGKLGIETIDDQNWVHFEKSDMSVVIDLGSTRQINSLAARFLTYKLKDIFLPTSVEFSVSDDGKNFRALKTVSMDQCLNDRYDCWIDIAFADNLKENGRYVKVYAINGIGKTIFTDELLVNPVYK